MPVCADVEGRARIGSKKSQFVIQVIRDGDCMLFYIIWASFKFYFKSSKLALIV